MLAAWLPLLEIFVEDKRLIADAKAQLARIDAIFAELDVMQNRAIQ